MFRLSINRFVLISLLVLVKFGYSELETNRKKGFHSEHTCMEANEPKLQDIIIFTRPEYRGDPMGYSALITCMNLPEREVGSIDTRGSCLVIYEEEKCFGKFTKVLRHDQAALDTKKVFGGVKSFRLCNHDDSYAVTIFKDQCFKGTYQMLKIPYSGSCININEEMKNRISSIYFPEPDTCIIVYTEQGCEGTPHRLYPASPGIDKLTKIGLNDKICSVRTCSAVDQGRMTYIYLYPIITGQTGRNSTEKIPFGELKEVVSNDANDVTEQPSNTIIRQKDLRERRIVNKKIKRNAGSYVKYRK